MKPGIYTTVFPVARIERLPVNCKFRVDDPVVHFDLLPSERLTMPPGETDVSIYTRDGLRVLARVWPGAVEAYQDYSYDGPTGAIDTADWLMGSLGHDILRQLMSAGLLPQCNGRRVERFMRRINRANRMSKARVWGYWFFVRLYQRIKTGF